MTTATEFNPANIHVQQVTDYKSAAEFIEWIHAVPDQLIGLDVETDGFNWFDGQLRLVQFGNLIEGWAVPYQEFKALVREALDILSARDKFFVGHNMKFDLHWLERHTGWAPKSWRFVHDTMALAAVLSSSGAKALKDLAEYYVWSGAKLGQKKLAEDMKEGGWTWDTVPVRLPSYWIYGVIDTILTVHLFYTLYTKAEKSGCLKAYETEMSAMPALFKMERKGMLLDREHATRMRDGLIARCAEIEQAVVEYGIENINSNNQIALAFERAGVPLTLKTSKGKWRMDKDTLEYIAATTHHPLVQQVKEHRRATRWSSTYYTNFLKYQRSDGRCHPFYYANVARTGRMSATEPAILTVPRAKTDKDVRNSFVAPEGHVLISTDFSNVEARIFAHYAKEEGMLQILRDGGDLHAYTAKEIYGLDEQPSKDDPRRQIAKSALFCTLFGGGAMKVAITAGVPLEEAEPAYAGLHKSFTGIKQFQKQCQHAAESNLRNFGQAFVRGIDGRILSMVQTDDRYYAFTNWQIQGTACTLLKQRLAVMENMGLTEYLVAAIHDEVVAEIPAEFEEDYTRMVKEAMEDHYSFSVPIVSETGHGAVRWGDAK